MQNYFGAFYFREFKSQIHHKQFQIMDQYLTHKTTLPKWNQLLSSHKSCITNTHVNIYEHTASGGLVMCLLQVYNTNANWNLYSIDIRILSFCGVV